jgi:putative nucleotidyltransferase with HDIG domain
VTKSKQLKAIVTLFKQVRPGTPWPLKLVHFAKALGKTEKETKEVGIQRCERAVQITAKLGFPRGAQDIVKYVAEYWDGTGAHNLRGSLIPIGARILGLAQAMDPYFIDCGPQAAIETAQSEAGKSFDPDLVRAFCELCQEEAFALDLRSPDLRQKVMAMEPQSMVRYVDEERLENIASAFAEIVDSKSPYTARHSEDVAVIAEAIARKLSFSEDEVYRVRVAALLHDLGKLSVPNTILDKPEKPTPDEWQRIQQHPYYTDKVLEPITLFRDIREFASSHHERLDGKGYFRGLKEDQIPLASRVIAVADVYQALSVDRPYRPRLETQRILEIMSKMQGDHISTECFATLKAIL